MGMGSSRPNWARRLARTSGGTLGLVASSSNGSPGASARTVNSTRLIPASTGIKISTRRSRYLDIYREPWTAGEPRRGPRPPVGLGLSVPVGKLPEVGVPAALRRPQLVADRGHPRPPDHRDGDHVLDDEVVHLDEHRGALDRVELALRGLVELAELLALPANDVAALPLVLFRGNLPGGELEHEVLGIGIGLGDRVHLQISGEVRIRVEVGRVRGEEHRGHYRLDLDLDARLGRRLLDDGLGLLAGRVDRGLIDHLELLAVLGPDPVGPLLPARRLQDLAGLLHVEL